MEKVRFVIGSNIRQLRRMRGWSSNVLAAQLSLYLSQDVSGNSILAYETGRRPVTAEMIFALAFVLDCSVQALLDGADPRLGDVPKAKHAIAVLSPEDHRAIRDIATNWAGNIHALIVAMAVYCALPPHRRRDVIMELLSTADRSIDAGEISAEAMPPGIDDLEYQTGGLF